MLRKRGTINKWDDEKGFGFILPDDSTKIIFVHIKSFTDRNIRPSINQKVTYTVQNNSDGKQSATNVSRSTDNPIRSRTNINKKFVKENIKKKQTTFEDTSKHNISIISLFFVGGFILFLFYFTMVAEKLPVTIIVVYLIMSMFTYFTYKLDKMKAINNGYRVPEKMLLLLSLLGGWIGALIAQEQFRHKNKKISFQVPFWLVVFGNIIWLSNKFIII